MVTGIRLGKAPAYRALVAMAELVRGSSRDWTLVPLPCSKASRVTLPRPRQIGDAGGLRLARAALADFLISELEHGTRSGQAPILADR